MSNFSFNRREFLRAAGLGAVSFALPGMAFAAGAKSAGGSKGGPGGNQTGNVDYGKPDSSLCGYLPDAGTDKKAFSFVAWGDPQVEESADKDFKASVKNTKKLNPDFVISLGDQVHTPNMTQYGNFLDHVEDLGIPLYMVVGNHDWEPWAGGFEGNAYGKQNFGNHIYTQKKTGDHELICYSFDAGEWHFIIAPEPGPGAEQINQYWDTHSNWLEWIADDLKKNKDRPTMFFAHAPLFPVGRRHFEDFNLRANFRKKLLDTLTMYGNVKYSFTGHVHTSVAAMPHLSWRYKGMTSLNIANAGRLSRGGRRKNTTGEDFPENVQSHAGLLNVRVNGNDIETLEYRCNSGEVIVIKPEEIQEYDDEIYGWLRFDGELPAGNSIVNGDFQRPLSEGWYVNNLFPGHLFDTSNPQIQKRDIVSDGGPGGKSFLHLYTKGQRRKMYFTSEARQAVKAPGKNVYPKLSFKYSVLSNEYRMPDNSSGYVVVSGWSNKDQKKALFHMMYFIGTPFRHLIYFNKADHTPIFSTAPIKDAWSDLVLDIRSDYERSLNTGRASKGRKIPWDSLDLDKLAINFGSGISAGGSGRMSSSAEMGIGFADVSMDLSSVSGNGDSPFMVSVLKAGRPGQQKRPGGKKK